MTQKVFIASSRMLQIGSRCVNWAENNMPPGFERVADPECCHVFISVLYDTILKEEFIRGRRCYNFHPGILPNYRGAGAYSWAIINKEKETGVTLHEIDPDIDSGPIIEIRKLTISQTDTAEMLFVSSMGLLFDMFKHNFYSLLTKDYPTQPNQGGSFYFRKDLDDVKDVSHIIRALTFTGKESAYWVDSKGNRHDLVWE